MISYLLCVVLLLTAPIMAINTSAIGACHPFPGAPASDVLKLIADNLDKQTKVDVRTRPVFTLRRASIVAVGVDATPVTIDNIMRMALTAIGNCALFDRGSISGTFTDEKGTKICYLYRGSENLCHS